MAVLIVSAACAAAHAQSSSVSVPSGSSEVKIEDVKAPEKKKTFSAAAQVEASTNLRSADDYKGARAIDYTFVPMFNILDTFTAKAEIVYTHDLKQEKESDFKDTSLVLDYKAIDIVPERLVIVPAVVGLLPTNEETRKTTSLQYGVGIAQKLILTLDKLPLPARLTYASSARRNVQEFTSKNDGSSNGKYSFSNRLIAEIDLGKKFSFMSRGTVFSSQTYRESWRSRFELLGELGYEINETFSVALGHVNSDATLKSNMNDSNVAFYNENTSSVYFDLNVTY